MKSDTLNWKKLVATATILIVVVAAVWFYLVASYESDLGTSNVVVTDSAFSTSDDSTDNQLLQLSFDDDGEDLLWSSLEISLIIDGRSNTCSFGSQSNSNQTSSKVDPNLGADGATFTTVIDATEDGEFTYLELAEQLEGNDSNYWMKFSSTDVFLNNDVNWTFVEGADFSEIKGTSGLELSSNTDDRLEWYTYDMSVHRVDPNDGVYVIESNNSWYKVKFLSYYNSEDESRYPTIQIAALDGTIFPALENPEIVVPSPCLIVTDDLDTLSWNADEKISLVENGIDLCNGKCVIAIKVEFETILVEIEDSEVEI